MIQLGKYKVGYVWRNATDWDKSTIGIYKGESLLCSFPTEEGKEVARLMMSWCGLNARTEFSDSELIEELKSRGYSGELTKRIEL